MKVHVLEVAWSEFAERLRAIRGAVFIDEQRVPQDIEWDGLDDDATHFLAIDEAGRDLGCARLLPTGQIGRMAVQRAHRGAGIGAALLQEAVRSAEAQGHTEVFLHAQTHAESFYAAHGFLAEGDEFFEADIPHRNMRRKLAIAYPGEATPVDVPDDLQPEQQRTMGTFFDNEPQALAALCAGLDGALRNLAIYSHFLDPAYFDQADSIERLSSLARRARNSEVRILIHSTSIIISRGHGLIELARRLPSSFQVRIVDADYNPPDSCFAVWDGRGFWRLADYREPHGVMRTDDPVRARQLTDTFDQLWSRSKTDPNLRLLRL